jgi:hypothetical protein
MRLVGSEVVSWRLVPVKVVKAPEMSGVRRFLPDILGGSSSFYSRFQGRKDKDPCCPRVHTRESTKSTLLKIFF